MIRFMVYFLLCSSSVLAQWELINPYPTFYNIASVKALTPYKYIFCTTGGEIFISENSGEDWNMVYKDQLFYFHNMFFVNENTGWAVGDSSRGVLKTTDGGYNWFEIPFPTGEAKLNIMFADENTGYFIERYKFFKSTDGGFNWSDITSNISPVLMFEDFTVIDENKIFLLNGGRKIFESYDGGNNWVIIDSILSESYFRIICFADSMNGFVMGRGKEIVKTTDGGLSWVEAVPFYGAGDYEITAGGFYNNTGIFLYFIPVAEGGDYGTYCMVRTSDKGVTWQDTCYNSYDLFSKGNSISFISDYTYISGGAGGHVIKSTDMGSSFSKLTKFISPPFMYDVVMLDKNLGYFKTENDILKTTDGGETFQRITMNCGWCLELIALNEDTLISNHRSEYIQYTFDQGLNWHAPSLPPNIWNAYNLVFPSKTVGYLGSTDGLLKTINSGVSWFIAGQEAAGFLSFIDENTGWKIWGNKVYKTIDGGISWTYLSTPANGISIISMLDSSIGIAATNDIYWTFRSYVYYTSDGGVSWYLSNFPPPYCSNIEIFNIGNTVLAYAIAYHGNEYAGYTSQVYFSSDTGKTWTDDGIETPTILGDISYADGYVWWSGVQHAVIIKKDISAYIPVEFLSLSAEINNKNVTLRWSTVSEKNNKGFEVERLSAKQNWIKIGFTEGTGTTTEKQNYTFTDENLSPGNYKYRLKQIDFDGSFEYSEEIEVTINIPYEYSLSQNYPNPFNPSTKIKYSIAKEGNVSLQLYDVLGNKIKTLINSEQEPGEYEIEFDGSSLSSGIYFYQLKAGEFSMTKKLVVVK